VYFDWSGIELACGAYDPGDLRVRNDTMKHDVASSDIAALQ